MIKDYSDLDLKSPSQYGMRPLLDFDKTCYQKVWFFSFCFIFVVDILLVSPMISFVVLLCDVFFKHYILSL